eukprot:TRINITY_DN8899_c0_g1_i1.p1 TRINITY_DN8899_c0_g1~~TRINITY_DN8899_c0_g1_i1.p1  ORF type:complete len:383 (-),score=103.29 TRINITY_DN8899_c0_g1_i1:221-1315(-)
MAALLPRAPAADLSSLACLRSRESKKSLRLTHLESHTESLWNDVVTQPVIDVHYLAKGSLQLSKYLSGSRSFLETDRGSRGKAKRFSSSIAISCGVHANNLLGDEVKEEERHREGSNTMAFDVRRRNFLRRVARAAIAVAAAAVSSSTSGGSALGPASAVAATVFPDETEAKMGAVRTGVEEEEERDRRRRVAAAVAADEEKLLEQNRRIQQLNQAPANFPGFVRQGFNVKVITGPGWVETPTGLFVLDIEPGTGTEPLPGQQVEFHYIGYNESGRRIDSTYLQGRPAKTRFGINGMIPGFEEGLSSMRVGGQRRIIIPPDLGPPTGPSTFFSAKQYEVFDIELLGVRDCVRRQIAFYSDFVCE